MQRLQAERASVVDEDVELAKTLDGLQNQASGGHWIAEIRLYRFSLTAVAFYGFDDLFGGRAAAAVIHGHARALRRQHLGCSGADTARSAGDERDFSA